MNKKSFTIIIILLVFSGIIGWTQYFKDYNRPDTVDIHAFPKQIGDWTATEIPITDKEYAILETRNAFTRKYTHSEGKAVYLFIVYSQTNPKAAHPPEICFSGGGVSILSNEPEILYKTQNAIIRTNKLKMEQGRLLTYVYYWFKAGKYYSPNYIKSQTVIAINKLLNKRTGNALIRISVTIDPDNPRLAEITAAEFTEQIFPLLNKYLP